MERLDLSADWVVERLRLVYLEAMRDKDYTAVLKALDLVAKHLGLYGEHNKQRQPVLSVDEMKARLTMLGVDWSRRNWPKDVPLTDG